MANPTPESDRRQGGWILLVAGPALLVAGLIAGLTNLTAYGQDCGSAFGPAGSGIDRTLGDTLVQVGCESVVDSRRGWAIGLITVGLIAAVIGGRLVAMTRRLPVAATTAVPITEELSRLARLHDTGALSDEEYAAAKAQVLGS